MGQTMESPRQWQRAINGNYVCLNDLVGVTIRFDPQSRGFFVFAHCGTVDIEIASATTREEAQHYMDEFMAQASQR